MTAGEYDPPPIAVNVGNFGRNNDQPSTGKRDAEPAPRSVLGTQREVMW